MIRNYFSIAWRNLLKSKGYSLINIGGLAAGMAVAMLIGLWIWDELSFDKYNKNYDRIAQLMQTQDFGGQLDTWQTMPYPVGDELREKYGSDFKQVVMSSWDFYKVLSVGDKKLRKIGKFMEPAGPALMDVQMLRGSQDALKDPSSILLSASTAAAYFGEEDPMGKTMRLDNKENLIVKGVYEDLPYNSSFSNIGFIAPWSVYVKNDVPWVKTSSDIWGSNSFLVYVKLADNVDMASASAKIAKLRAEHVGEQEKRFKPVVFLHPMSKWHLHEEFKNGVNSGGRIQFVWLFGIIGVFVLLLACINFMNLSTARSEKRAREVGIRKAIGSFRSQLIGQFFSESLLVVALAFVVCIGITQLILPFFNNVADKKISILWSNPLFWLTGIVVTLLTGLVAGSYPAFYLSSFQPVKVLKGTFRVGRNAALPRKILVVMQFTVSLVLIIGTIVVFRQVQFARTRPVGYSREGLITMELNVPDIHDHFEAVRTELINSGAIIEMSETSTPATNVWQTNGDISWKGKDPNLAIDMPNVAVTSGYGKAVGWQFKAGRDFSRDFSSDSSAFVVNEAAVKFMGLKDPVGEIVQWGNMSFTIIGVVKDMIMESPYQPVRPALFHLNKDNLGIMLIRIHPKLDAHAALAKIESVFKRYSPEQPFDYQFVDVEYARKFETEVRVGKLTGFFSMLAIFISCLGLFGMASFMVERRTKEIGVRKVLGASVFNLWTMLSKDFVGLVGVAFLIAGPVGYYFMGRWLERYQYRAEMAWWVFVVAGVGVLVVTLVTVSFQSVRAALMNPVKSLKAE
ncbi:ABC transporter permease [Chitinophaga filiformis]|uniref:ABC-type antimicrobial peptide transport system, permease component n=1 Tax=Chitinophaga filiformis TaxID=104663 RepID=A0A1G7Y235_CHIFI|nr:ABC transporter permease [Chitinophaga filiformis]SDG90467.1 ABC-type antimicrobial peptide transport system, permease component [Chitinophaga filiformis]